MPRHLCGGGALPLVHSAWLTAIVFSIANALVLNVRIRAENSARATRDRSPTLIQVIG